MLGDQSRHSDNYTEAENSDAPRSYLDSNTTNAYAEQFVSIVKKDISQLKLPIDKFVKKCLEEQRGLRRQFLNGILIGMNAEKDNAQRKSSDKQDVFKDSEKVQNTKWNNTVKRLCEKEELCHSDNEFDSSVHKLEESWSKKQGPLHQGNATRKLAHIRNHQNTRCTLRQQIWRRMLKSESRRVDPCRLGR